MRFEAFEPFLNPAQVRILLALHDGPKAQGEIAERLDRDVRSVRKHIVKLHRWGLVRHSLGERKFRLAKPWHDTLLMLRQIVESHLRGVLSAIDDFEDARLWKAAPPAKDDLISYLHEVRRRGP